MSFHIISIDSTTCEIACSKGQLVVRSPEGLKTVPLEDVASIVISSFKCTLSSNFLIDAARHRIGVVLCEAYKPACLLLPADRATDTAIIRHLATLTPQLKRRLWQKTIDAKCYNQYQIAAKWNPEHALLPSMKCLLSSLKDTKESEMARMYWRVFSDTFTDGEFTRGREYGGYNDLFNYAYSIILSSVLRNLFALGLDPTFGIYHASRAHATPLAYDLMEPYRPIFDYRITAWIQCLRENLTKEEEIQKVTREYRQHLVHLLADTFIYQNKEATLKNIIELSIRSFRKSVEALQSGPYEPWKI